MSFSFSSFVAGSPARREHRRSVGVLLLLLRLSLSLAAQTPPRPAGTLMHNQATVRYGDGAGATLGGVSNLVSVTLTARNVLETTPDETTPTALLAQYSAATASFIIRNLSNQPWAAVVPELTASAGLTAGTSYFDLDHSGTVTAGDTRIVLGQTESPVLAPGAGVTVLVEFTTGALPPAPAASLVVLGRTAPGTPGNTAQDPGTRLWRRAEGPVLSLAKTVNGVEQTEAGAQSILPYRLLLRNSGGSPALNVNVRDALEAGQLYQSGSITLNGATLTDAADGDAAQITGTTIFVRLAQLNAGEEAQITFRAALSAEVPPGRLLQNRASALADNSAPVESNLTGASFNPRALVYDGAAGSAVPLPQAVLTLRQGGSNGPPVLLPDAGFTPNATPQRNPFTTPDGFWAFRPAPGQSGNFYLTVTAAGYYDRAIEVRVTPGAGAAFTVQYQAQDGQPLARAGGFALTDGAVSLPQAAGIIHHIPLFKSGNLSLAKRAERAAVQIGDLLGYQLEVRNSGAAALHNVVVADTLPASFYYVAESARLMRQGGEVPLTPQLAGNILSFAVGDVPAGALWTISFRVRLGVNAPTGEVWNTAAVRAAEETPPPVRAAVLVGNTAFGSRQWLVGQVYLDLNGNNEFDEKPRRAGETPDVPVPSARLITSTGRVVLTDKAGNYSYPLAGDGALVLGLDAATVPAGYGPADPLRGEGRRWTKLVQTPLQGGTLLVANWPLRAGNTGLTSFSGSWLPDGEGFSDTDTEAGTGTGAGSLPPVPAPPLYPLPAFSPRVEAIAEGEVKFDLPDGWVSLNLFTPLPLHVAAGSTARLFVNGIEVPPAQIGERREDAASHAVAYVFLGVPLVPGPNKVEAVAVTPEGTPARRAALTVYGPGPAVRFALTPDKDTIAAGGRAVAAVTVAALDAWGHPAADTEVRLSTDQGSFAQPGAREANAPAPAANPAQTGHSLNATTVLVRLAAGQGRAYLLSAPQPGTATLQLASATGQLLNNSQLASEAVRVHFVQETAQPVFVGYGQLTLGRAAPLIQLRGLDRRWHANGQFFFRGPVPKVKGLLQGGVLTLAYNSERPLNRLQGDRLEEVGDRILNIDPYFDQPYQVFGDTSFRFNAAPANSPGFARYDQGRSFFQFGDFTPAQRVKSLLGTGGDTAAATNSASTLLAARNETGQASELAAYNRLLTGVQLHAENKNGSFLEIAGARPHTQYGRDVLAGGTPARHFLSARQILPNSETVLLEVRDRRNPDLILRRANLVRNLDYTLENQAGLITFLRNIPALDEALNLQQVIVSYEFLAAGARTNVYLVRGALNLTPQSRLGVTFNYQDSPAAGAFLVAGLDFYQRLPHNGFASAECARSSGRNLGFGNYQTDTRAATGAARPSGTAYLFRLEQPLPAQNLILRGSASFTGTGFSNPFGGTLVGGSTRTGLALEWNPYARTLLRGGATYERNRTRLADNRRTTLGLGVTQTLGRGLSLAAGYDFRTLADRTTLFGNRTSHLLSFGADYKPTARLNFSARREQNVGAVSDPTYPDNWLFGASYQLNPAARVFFTQRFSAAPLQPLNDLSGGGFGLLNSKNETALGLAATLGKNTALTGAYRLEGGVSSHDSFAVIGLGHKLSWEKKHLAFEVGLERAQLLRSTPHAPVSGTDEGGTANNPANPAQVLRAGSYNSVFAGVTYNPHPLFVSSARYQWRSRTGGGHLLAGAASGQPDEAWTLLGHFQYARNDFPGDQRRAHDALIGAAWRPRNTDRYGLFFSYGDRRQEFHGITLAARNYERFQGLTADAFRQYGGKFILFGKTGARFSASARGLENPASNLTYLVQGRAEYRFRPRWDVAAEGRFLRQPATGTARAGGALEWGFRPTADLRLGGGYNYSRYREADGRGLSEAGRRGFYLNVQLNAERLFKFHQPPAPAPVSRP